MIAITCSELWGTFTLTPPPVITSLDRTSGVACQTEDTIVGSGSCPAQGSSSVTFNGAAASAGQDILVRYQDYIVVGVPCWATSGPAAVTVAGVAGRSASFAVIPMVVEVDPASGLVGAPVWIRGCRFGQARSSSTATSNGVDAGAATSWSATDVLVKAPAQAATGSLVVTVGGMASGGGGRFAVLPGPAIYGVSPVWGVAGRR